MLNDMRDYQSVGRDEMKCFTDVHWENFVLHEASMRDVSTFLPTCLKAIFRFNSDNHEKLPAHVEVKKSQIIIL